jgi:signal transduction histidine kinase/CheY-like chemotaxis protein
MKDLSRASQYYILGVIVLGGLGALWCLRYLEVAYPLALIFAFILATIFQILKIEGPTARSSYSLSWVVYAAVFVSMGWPAMLITIIVAHIGEWFRHRYPWYIQSFNIAVYSITTILAGLIYDGLMTFSLASGSIQYASAIFIAMLIFTLVNHLMVGLVIKLARNQSIRESGVFTPTTLLIDFGLLSLGVSTAIIIEANVAAVVFLFVVAIILHIALRVPALEREAERIAGLARSSQAKYEFVATMNHELRTPLNAVLLYADSLQRKFLGPLNERQERAARTILGSAQHLLSIIDDILDVAKLDADKLGLEITTTDVENVCQSSILLVSELAQKKQLALHYHRSPDVSQLDVDERRLKQMLVNLLSNAIKFTPESGEIGLDVNGDTESNFVHFTVWDRGIGISQENIKKLFQPFVQVDVTLARQGGTGLGLYLVQRMAALHGGRVSVTSEINQGSRFTISLPWGKGQQSSNQEGQVPVVSTSFDTLQAEGGLQKVLTAHSQDSVATVNAPAPRSDHLPPVLIADDSEANLQVLSDFLQNLHCRVVTARTGIEAVQQTKKEHPRLIFMDIQMPEMGGLEAIRQIRGEPSVCQIPIVVLTAFHTAQGREQCLAAGANDYLGKPLQVDQLTTVLATFIGGMPVQEQV